MKSQIKRFSKSTISVVLAICMLVSCATVGLIATDAAYDDSESVGNNEFNQKYLYVDMSSYSSYTLTGVNAYWNYDCNDGDMWNTTKTNMGDNIYRFDLSSMNSSYLYFRGFKVVTSGNSNTIGVVNGQTNNMIKVSSTGTLSWTTFSAYYVASGENSFTGNSWDAADINGKMSASGTNYVKTFSNVNQKTYKYKVTKNGNWDNAYPADNIECVVPFNGASVTITKDSSNNVSHKIKYTHTASSATNGRVYVGTTTGTSVTTDYANNETTYTIYATPNSNYIVNTISVGGTVIYTNSSNATGTISQTRTYTGNETVSATFKVANTKLSKPTNVALASSTVTAAPNSTVRLSWTSVTNAGSYKVFLDGALKQTVTTAYYDIDKKASSAGDYTVVAVPSSAASYSESDASSAVSLTVNKTSLPTPSVTIDPLDIASGSSTTATFGNYSSLSSYISGGYATLTRGTRAYEASSGAFTTNTAVTSTSGSETLSPTNSIQYAYYMAVTTAGSEYYTQSEESDSYDVFVAASSWYLIGDISGNWIEEKSDYKLTSYNGDNIFYYVYTATGSKYFSFSSGGTRYNPKGATYESPCDVTSIGSQEDAIELESNDASSSFHISSAGTYVIYIDQTNNTVWVEQNTRLLNIHAYTQTFNLANDSYNTPTESTTGGTVDPSGEKLVNKNTSTTLTATQNTGYTFVGWYNNTDFANNHRISTNASYTFTVTSDGNYYALFKQNEPAHYTLSVASVSNATVTATYNGTTLQEGSGSKSVPVGATVSYTITLDNGYQLDSTTPSGLSSGSGTFTMPASNTAVSATVSKITYNLTAWVTINSSTVTTSYGTLKFYSNSGCTTEITTAQVGDVFYAKYTPLSTYYTSGTFAVYSGTGVTGPTNQATNIKKFTMGYSDATITANVVATTPELTCTGVSDGVYAGESFTYSGASVTPAASANNLTLSYTFPYNGSGSVTNSTGEFAAPTTAGTYKLLITATCQPPGITSANAVTVTQEVNIVVKYHEETVKYYIDMHNNNMQGKTLDVAIVSNGSGSDESILKDSEDHNCIGNLLQQGDSTVYAASIATPATKVTNSDSYQPINLRIRYGSNGNWVTKIVAIDSSYSTPLMDAVSPEVWLEANNEAANTYKVTYANNSTTAVQSGKKRLYVAKPLNWETAETSWTHLHLYHWGDYADIGWNSAPLMTHIGSDSNYHYYYIDVDSGIDNIIFQGWKNNSTSPDVQTENIEKIGSSNFFVLSKDNGKYYGTKSDENETVPGYTRYVSSVDMNVGETANIAPVNTGKKVIYSSNNNNVTVSEDGDVTATGSALATITVKVYGSVGARVTSANPGDVMTYECTVNVHNPGIFKGYRIISFDHQEYNVIIPTISGANPGYFNLDNASVVVNGLYDDATSTYITKYANSAIIEATNTIDVDGVGNDLPIEFTVKYAASNSNTGYSNITLDNATITTVSIKKSGQKRFGFKEWIPSQANITSSKTIDNGVETVVHKGLAFSSGTTTYQAKFEEYNYVDVTFTFNYDEYVPKVVDGMIQYPYDADWANNEDSSNDQLYGRSHNTKTVKVSNFEIRNLVKSDIIDKTSESIVPEKLTLLVNGAAQAMGVMPESNYYNYKIDADTIPLDKISKVEDENQVENQYAVNVTVNMSHSVKQYKVYVNGVQIKDSNNNPLTYTYQQYAEPSVQNPADWYAVDDRNSIDTTNAPLLATGVNSYRFRVKGSANSTNTYLRTAASTNPHGDDFLRSEVDFSHYEVTHQGSDSDNMKEYLMQNFYIADFFSPAEVLSDRPKEGGGFLPYDDAQFVGGGVVYYSMNGATENNQGTPFANAVSSGYVNGSDGKINANAIKEMLKSNIEAQYAKDNIAGAVGENEAMKIAYGTEIAATKNKEGGFNTGIIYRYLPLNQYKRDGNGTLLAPDQDGNYAYDVNTNTFRYSNSLQSYQYVYASGNENKETNTGKNMRLYSYFVYSYTAYNQETNVPETRYEIVISDNYSDASTYWEGNPNP